MRLRRGRWPALISAALGAAFYLLAAPAGTAVADPAGNNGTVKIDELAVDDGNANNPHVPCDFDVTFYDFDKDQTADITFAIHPPSGNGTVLLSEHRVISDDAAGGGQDKDAVLTYSGTAFDLGRFTRQPQQGYHVKLTIVSDGVPGGQKHKVFWLDCAAPTPTPSGSPTPTTPPSENPTEPPSTTTPSTPGSTLPPTTPGGGGGDDGSLPITGTATAGIALLGLALLGGGVALVVIRRRRDKVKFVS